MSVSAHLGEKATVARQSHNQCRILHLSAMALGGVFLSIALASQVAANPQATPEVPLVMLGSQVKVNESLGTKASQDETKDSTKLNQSGLDTILLNVDKSSLQAELRTWPETSGLSSVLTTFKIAVGKADGDKEFEGDNRTPEGIYFVQNHIDGQVLPEKYGPLAIPIDFPNPIDQVSGKTGHGIWLHGVDREQRIEEAKVTEGCVAFYNNDIKILSNWLKSNQGIVVIAKDLAAVNLPADIEKVRQQTLDWITAWAGRDSDSYGRFYADSFRYAKYDLKGYLDYKKRVFSGYRKMIVLHDRLRVVTHPKYAVSFFNQDFRGDQRFVSIGRKVLYWEKDPQGVWKIKREVFENRRFEELSLSEGELAALSDRKPGRVGEAKTSGSSL